MAQHVAFAFISMPDDVVRYILTTWLLSEDVATADSAFCSTVDRPRFVQLLHKAQLHNRWDQSHESFPVVPFLLWSIAKSTRLHFLALDGKSTYSTAFTSGALESLVAFAKLVRVGNDAGLRLVAKHAKQLEELRIVLPQSGTGGANFNRTLTNVTRLMVDACLHGMASPDCLLSLTKVLPNLKYCNAQVTCIRNDEVISLLQHCPHLTELNCNHCPHINNSIFITQSSSLQKLHIVGCNVAAMFTTEDENGEFKVDFKQISPSFYLDIDTEDDYAPGLVTQWGISLQDFEIASTESNNVHTELTVHAPIIVGFPRLEALYILVREPDLDDDAESATSDGGDDGGDGSEEDEEDEGEDELVDTDTWSAGSLAS